MQKKLLSLILIILIALNFNLTVKAISINEETDYISNGVAQYTLQDHYKYNNYNSGLQFLSLGNNTTEEKILNALDNIISKVDISDELKGVSKDNKEEIDKVMSLYFDTLYKNPEIFYASNNVRLGYSYNSKTDEINSAELVITYLYDNDTILDMKKKLNEKVDYILNNYLEGVTNDLQKEYIISDYIVNNTTYDYDNYLNDSVPELSFTSYGALINGVAVCEGYSKAATLLMDKVGIESGIVISNEMRHAWNYVKIDNKYYHLDLTWNDSIPETNRTNYKYFNLSNEEIEKDHYGWDDMAYPDINGDAFSQLRTLVDNQYNDIARIDDKLYYIDGINLYSSDLYGKNKKLVDELGDSAQIPISYKENIIYKDGRNIKIYNINTKTTSVIYKEEKSINKFYVKDDLLYVINSNGTKKINLLIKEDLIKEDLNYDGIIDINDIALIAIKYNSTSKSSNWNSDFDLNQDGIIDIFDLITIARKI